ncbi:NADH dehydrogenase [ubiquinone] 1 alpha subcomplex subunit 5 [Ceratina calcarata]|uniref:NADH dehydrogenase [ubiquinone] 1 alpha subcomplex subunit 5 n=1 Tax=Ceratina calcarata TaxID=156304 RepID=A0AAJ7N3Q6_9HYME|nr:NADH dehydrogenase [ubiquinone] 1 alpha subcomplex subunit 5 [Ceratina calcarata]
MAGALKKTTGLTGLAVSKHPHTELRLIYDRLLRLASHLPADYTYRKSVENLVKERSEILQQSPNVADIEAKIGQGQIEEIIVHAQNELALMKDIVEQKPWENLIEKAPPHQWTWPAHQ